MMSINDEGEEDVDAEALLHDTAALHAWGSESVRPRACHAPQRKRILRSMEREQERWWGVGTGGEA